MFFSHTNAHEWVHELIKIFMKNYMYLFMDIGVKESTISPLRSVPLRFV